MHAQSCKEVTYNIGIDVYNLYFFFVYYVI